MGLVDKVVFEARGARGTSDSDYTFAMTTCCERVGVVDEELSDFYWNCETPKDCVSLLDAPDCPLCTSPIWSLNKLESLTQVPEHWRWACDGVPRAGRRQLLHLSVYLEELLEFCQRVAGPVPPWTEAFVYDGSDGPLGREGPKSIRVEALVSLEAFAPRFEELLGRGYPWVRLSVRGVHERRLVLEVAVPTEASGVPRGRTVVKYDGPPLERDGVPNWTLSLAC